jgi:hypothetical protein
MAVNHAFTKKVLDQARCGLPLMFMMGPSWQQVSHFLLVLRGDDVEELHLRFSQLLLQVSGFQCSLSVGFRGSLQGLGAVRCGSGLAGCVEDVLQWSTGFCTCVHVAFVCASWEASVSQWASISAGLMTFHSIQQKRP